MARQIGTLGTIDTITVGGRVFTDLTTLIYLEAYTATTARYTTYRKNNTSAGYQVTTGKTLSIYAIRVMTDSAAGSSAGSVLSYGDTDVGLNSAAAPTNVVYQFGDSTARIFLTTTGQTSGVFYESPTLFTVPATKYAAQLAVGNDCLALAFGYEA